jgi:dihydrofolate reductase
VRTQQATISAALQTIDVKEEGPSMTRIITGLAMSLDGYIAGPDDSREHPLGTGGDRLFEWYFDGDTSSHLYPSFRLSQQSAEFFDELAGRCGAVITGRHTYDLVDAWNGKGPLPGAPLFVLTHRVPDIVPDGEPPYTFVTGGIGDAVDQARVAAGDKDVSVMGSAGVQQALQEGLLDEIIVHLVPVLLGGGVRLLEGIEADLRCTRVVDAPGVTHLSYDVVR